VKKQTPPGRGGEGIYFFTTNQLGMLYFLIKKANALHLLPVPPADEVTFRLLYDQQILVEGTSILDVLRQFQELPLIIEDGW